MTTDADRRHLTSRQIQELLDQQLTSEEEALVREHVSVCPRCRSEVEGWQLLFSDLENLPGLNPGPAFAGEVLDQVAAPTPLGLRIREWLGVGGMDDLQEIHVPDGSIQDYLEAILPSRPAARVEAHLKTCTTCQNRVGEWEGLLASFQTLEALSPRPGFAERVMEGVQVSAPVPARAGWGSLPARALAWARGFFPKSRHGWAVAGGVASAPTITIGALAYLVFSRPLLTTGNLSSYLLWKGTELMQTLVAAVTNLATGSAILVRVFAFFEPVTESPMLLGLGGVGLSLVSAGALWVLYRNLIVPSADDRYARARV